MSSGRNGRVGDSNHPRLGHQAECSAPHSWVIQRQWTLLLGHIAERPMERDVCRCGHRPPPVRQQGQELLQLDLPRRPAKCTAQVADTLQVARDGSSGKGRERRVCRKVLQPRGGMDPSS